MSNIGKTTNSSKSWKDFSVDFTTRSMKGEILPPQLWVYLMNESQAQTIITKYATPADSLFVESPEIVKFPDGKAAVCFKLKNGNDIRKLVDILTSTVRIVCNGFVSQLPEADRSYLLKKLSSSGEGMDMGGLLLF